MQEKKDYEIYVSHEMALIGAEIVTEYDAKFITSRDVAIRVYRAMECARLRGRDHEFAGHLD